MQGLRRVLKKQTAAACGLCSAGIAEKHQHLYEPKARRIECVCDGCAILFTHTGETKYLRVPRRTQFLPDFRLPDLEWDALAIPIGIAFMYRAGDGGVSAMYPSPAGPVESLLQFHAWDRIVSDNPMIRNLQADVEGLLVYRIGDVREHYIVPIDECFRLVGLIRMQWKGLSGGQAVWETVSRFFDELKRQCQI